jgi:hypothetical protein
MNSFKEIFNSSPNTLKDIIRSHWGAKQNTTYHPEGNTLKHIITVVNRAIRKYPNNPNMILAAYFHDLGKMETYNIKDGKPTAHGHEKVSHRLVEEYSDFIEEMGGDPEIVAYIVSNHMKMKPHVWDVMRDKKKEKITDHPNFNDLEGFSKIDKGGLHLESVIRKVLKEETDKDWDFMDDHTPPVEEIMNTVLGYEKEGDKYKAVLDINKDLNPNGSLWFYEYGEYGYSPITFFNLKKEEYRIDELLDFTIKQLELTIHNNRAIAKEKSGLGRKTIGMLNIHKKEELLDTIKSVRTSDLKESVDDDWDWAREVEPAYSTVRTDNDYMRVWHDISLSLVDSCVEVVDGYVISDDYAGEIDIELTLPNETYIKIWLEMDTEDGDNNDEYVTYWELRLVDGSERGYDEEIFKESGEYSGGEYRNLVQPILDTISKRFSC